MDWAYSGHFITWGSYNMGPFFPGAALLPGALHKSESFQETSLEHVLCVPSYTESIARDLRQPLLGSSSGCQSWPCFFGQMKVWGQVWWLYFLILFLPHRGRKGGKFAFYPISDFLKILQKYLLVFLFISTFFFFFLNFNIFIKIRLPPSWDCQSWAIEIKHII